MELESAGNVKLVLDGQPCRLDVFTCDGYDDDGKPYYVVHVQKECFEKVFAAIGNVKHSSGELDIDPQTFFPDSEDDSETGSRVVVMDAGSDAVLDDQVIDFRPRMFLRAKLPQIIDKVSGLVKRVLDENPDVTEVSVMIGADGESSVRSFSEEEIAADNTEWGEVQEKERVRGKKLGAGRKAGARFYLWR